MWPQRRYLTRDGSKNWHKNRNVTRNRAAIEAKKKSDFEHPSHEKEKRKKKKEKKKAQKHKSTKAQKHKSTKEQKNKRTIEQKKKKKKKKKRKRKKTRKKQRKEASKGTHPRRLDSFFLVDEMLHEIVKQLRPKQNQIFGHPRKEKGKEKRHEHKEKTKDQRA